MARLGDYIQIKKGSKIEQTDCNMDSIRFIQIDDLRNNKNVKYCDPKEEYTVADENDVLLAWDGANAGTIGYGKAGAIGSTLSKISFDHNIFYPAYIGLVLKSKNEYLRNHCTGATIPHINRKSLEQIVFNIPSIDVQKRIADILDKASQIIELRKQQIEKMDLLVKSQFIELFGDPKDNSKQWPVYNLDELCKVGSSKRLYQNEQTTEGIPFLRISDLVQRIETGEEDCNLFIPVERYEELKSQDLVPTVGDILVTSRGTLGACYIVKDTDSFYFQDGMISWLYGIEKSILPLYISYLFATQGFRTQIDRLQAGSTVAYLSISMMKKLRIMLPPHDIQTQFVTFVQQVDKSKFAMNQSLERLEQCRNALMQKAFE